jgi:ABC-type branched-subunit amino acid transport system substrate-binding protein
MLGAKAAVALRAAGDEASASRLEQDTGVVRRTLAIDPSQSPPSPGDPLRFGLAVPLSGTQSRLGEVVLRSASLVVGTPVANGQPSPYHLVVRDSAAPTDRAPAGPSSAVWSLSRDENAIGLMGTPDPRAVELATREGLPFLLLDERAPGARTTAFQLIHSPESRAAALASRALQLGARRFAILGPDTPAGKRLAAAFRDRMIQGGATQAAGITYAAKATAFSAQVKQLHTTAFDVLFVPDDATRLELIAPALAVADIWPRQPRQLGAAPAKAGTGRREILLVSTALSLSQRLLQNAERYVQGAMLCPGYYPAEDARGGSFAARFRELYGTAPTAADAYGYDGLALLRSAVERGARTKADVLRLLSRETFEGVTGDVRFGPDHARTDPPTIYVVEGDTIRTLR